MFVLRVLHAFSKVNHIVHTRMKGDDNCQGIFHQEENHFIRTIGHVGQKIPTDDEKRQILGQSDVDHRPHRCAEEPFVQE